MGVSTNAELNFGVLLGEEDEDAFPWIGENFDEFESWWRKTQGFKSSVQPFNSSGDYMPGVHGKSPIVRQFFDEQHAWDAANPPPVALVNYCSSECSMVMLAVPGIGHSARRGYPTLIDPASLTVTQEQVQALLKFCEDYGITFAGEPGWFLTSYWG